MTFPPPPPQGAWHDAYRRAPTLALGDGFARPATDAHAVRQALSRYKRGHPGWDYRTLVVDGEIRVWRMA